MHDDYLLSLLQPHITYVVSNGALVYMRNKAFG